MTDGVLARYVKQAPELKSFVLRNPYCDPINDELGKPMRAYPTIVELAILHPFNIKFPVEGHLVSCNAVERLRVDFVPPGDHAGRLWQMIRAPRLRSLMLCGPCDTTLAKINLARITTRDTELVELHLSVLDINNIAAVVELIHTSLVVSSTFFTRKALKLLCCALAHRSEADGSWANPKLVEVHLEACQFDVDWEMTDLFDCATLRMMGFQSQVTNCIQRLQKLSFSPLGGEVLSSQAVAVITKLNALLASPTLN